MSPETDLIPLPDAEALLRDALTANGVIAKNAASVAAALVAAEAEGRAGHGFSRLPDYVAQARSGKVDGSARPVVAEHGPASATVDAGDGFAYPALDVAVDWLSNAARSVGTASVGVRRSHHCGALSVQVDRIAQAGLVGLMVANSPPGMAPWGAREAIYGTNPIAFAAPRKNGPPLVIDLSLSRVARGKIMHAKKTGGTIPEGWALDADGQPTTDPEAAMAGTMVPIGEAKGTALALMVEVLAAVLAGANLSTDTSSFFSADGPPSGAGQFLMAFRPAGQEAFLERIERLLSLVEGLDGARLPGSRRATALAAAQSKGIRVPRQYLETARQLAKG